ncbi:MAG: hypothetical protein Q9M08_01480, partial [Mariprofundus sp.]|nr:hypothetical protein [Mariprofundus sp.]
TRLWLSGYGVVRVNSVELIPLTSGFNIAVSPAGTDQVRVRIVPWMKRISGGRHRQHDGVIEIAGAKTEMVIPVDESVTIAASNQEAKKLGAALLSRSASITKHQFIMHLRVIKN